MTRPTGLIGGFAALQRGRLAAQSAQEGHENDQTVTAVQPTNNNPVATLFDAEMPVWLCNRFPAGPLWLTARACRRLQAKANRRKPRSLWRENGATPRVTDPCPGCPGVVELARIHGREPRYLDTSRHVAPAKGGHNGRLPMHHKCDAVGPERKKRC